MSKLFLYGRSMKNDKTTPYATLTVYCPVGVTVRANSVNGTDTFDIIAHDGKAVFGRLKSGAWDVTFVGTEHAPTERIIIDDFDNEIIMTYFKTTVNVTYPVGSVCTCTCIDNGKVLTASDTSGAYTFTVRNAGTWEISCTDGDQVQSTIMKIANNGDNLNVSLTYNRLAVIHPDYPADITVKSGTVAIFDMIITEDGYPTDYAYQWYVDDVAVIGANSRSYSRSTYNDRGVHSVYCEMTTVAGSIKSRTATFIVNRLPMLNENYPADVDVLVGESATFDVLVDVDGYPSNYAYQWYVNDAAVAGATDSSYTVPEVVLGVTTVYCAVTNIAGTVVSRTTTLTGISTIPVFEYDGDYEIVDDNDNIISESADDWKIRFLTSGTLRFTALNGAADGIDVFCVGGGGAGGQWSNGGCDGSGGCGGFTKTKLNVSVQLGEEYSIIVGSGGASNTEQNPRGNDGGHTSAFNVTANGGSGGSAWGDNEMGFGGSGGGSGNIDHARGGDGGSDGSDGIGMYWVGGKGQGETTKEFREDTGKLYAGGGGGSWNGLGGAGGGADAGISALSNTGGGGGGAYNDSEDAVVNGGAGGSGIVIIRNKR